MPNWTVRPSTGNSNLERLIALERRRQRSRRHGNTGRRQSRRYSGALFEYHPRQLTRHLHRDAGQQCIRTVNSVNVGALHRQCNHCAPLNCPQLHTVQTHEQLLQRHVRYAPTINTMTARSFLLSLARQYAVAGRPKVQTHSKRPLFQSKF